MKSRLLLWLCLSVGLSMAAPAALADDVNGKGKGEGAPRSERAMQVRIDKNTGKIMNEDDDSAQNAIAAATDEPAPVVDVRGVMPAAAGPQEFSADGTVSVRLGTSNLEYLVMTIGEDGEKALSHQKADELNLEHVALDRGEE